MLKSLDAFVFILEVSRSSRVAKLAKTSTANQLKNI